MQAAVRNGDSVEDDAGSTDVVWNAENGSEIQNGPDSGVSDSLMVSSLFLNFDTELKWEEHNGLVREHSSGTPNLGFPCEASRVSVILSDILKAALSPVFGQESAEATSNNVNEKGEGIKRARYGANLTEEERRAERNRKGRERSMRTRRRNAAHLQMLEAGCTGLITENRLLRDVINCLQRVPLAEERVMSLLRSLLCHSRVPSAFHPALGLLRGFAAPLNSNASRTYHKMLSNVEGHGGSCVCDDAHQVCPLLENETQMANADSTRKVDTSALVWELEQIGENLPESSNVSKTSMTPQRSLETSTESEFEARFHESANVGNEVREGERSVAANFSLDEIEAVISL